MDGTKKAATKKHKNSKVVPIELNERKDVIIVKKGKQKEKEKREPIVFNRET